MFHVGDVVRKLRIKRGWSQGDLAEAAGVDKNTVGAIERGAANSRADTLVQVAAALETSVERLHAEVPRPQQPSTAEVLSPDTESLLKTWEAFTPEMQKVVLQILRHLAEGGVAPQIEPVSGDAQQRKA